MTSKATSYAILEFLKTQLDEGKVGEDERASIEVAFDCLAEAFFVDLRDPAQREAYSLTKRGASLEQLCTAFLKNQHIQPAPVSTAMEVDSTAASTTEATTTSKLVEEEQAIIEQAEKLKAEGNVLMQQKNYQGAIDKYTEAINLKPDVAIYYTNRAAAYSCIRKFEESKKDCEIAISLNPNYVKSYSRLGLAEYKLNRFDAAVKAYQKALQLEPGNERILSDLKLAEEKLKNTESASPAAAAAAAATAGGGGSGASQARATPGGAGGIPPGLAGLAASLGGGVGGAGGMPDLGSMLQNPALMQMAMQMMNNPNIMSMLSDPSFEQTAQQMMTQMPGLASMLGGSGGGGAGDNDQDENNESA